MADASEPAMPKRTSSPLNRHIQFNREIEAFPKLKHSFTGLRQRPLPMVGALLDRRKLLIGAAALGTAGASARAAAAFEWQSITPDEAGFAPDFAARLDQFVATRLTNTHGLIVARRGHIVFEKYYEGDDVMWIERRPQPARIAFTAERSHDLRSVTKGIVGLLYGIALADGKVPPPAAPLLAQFPQYADLPDMAQRGRWTIAHALTMTLGTEWNEEVSYEDLRNGQTAMEMSPDRVRY